MNLIFISTKQDIYYYTIFCFSDDLFVNVEKKLYEKYPNYIETENIFNTGGRKIVRFKTIKENQIESDSSILLIPLENDSFGTIKIKNIQNKNIDKYMENKNNLI